MFFSSTVPLYDGRNPFTIDEYEKLPVLFREIPVGAAVMVVFTAGKYSTPETTRRDFDMWDVPASISFNVLAVVLLENPDAEACAPDEDFNPDMHAFGVSFPVRSGKEKASSH